MQCLPEISKYSTLGPKQGLTLKSEKENDFGGAVEFSQELEKKILGLLGKSSKYIFLIIFQYEWEMKSLFTN